VGGDDLENLNIIDFGLSIHRSKSPHIRGDEGLALGDPRFMSINCSRSRVHTDKIFFPSAWDDLESVAYVLMYLLKGELPWSKHGPRAFDKIFENKKDWVQAFQQSQDDWYVDSYNTYRFFFHGHGQRDEIVAVLQEFFKIVRPGEMNKEPPTKNDYHKLKGLFLTQPPPSPPATLSNASLAAEVCNTSDPGPNGLQNPKEVTILNKWKSIYFVIHVSHRIFYMTELFCTA
jgi:hypothetical protein